MRLCATVCVLLLVSASLGAGAYQRSEFLFLDEIKIGMPLQVVPRIFEELEEIRVYYTLEKPGTTWGVAGS